MRRDKNQAAELRKAGKSYREIEHLIRVPRSTLSNWFGAEAWSKEIKERVNALAIQKSTVRIIALDKLRGEKLEQTYEEARLEARREMMVFKYHPLFLVALALYWGEGDKTSKGAVRIGTIDAAMLRVFRKFLIEICGVESGHIKAWVLLYPDLNDQDTKRYWSESIGIPLENFIKSTLVVGRHKTKKTVHGVCTVYISSTYLKAKILEWLSVLPEELMSGNYYASIEDAAGMVQW